LNQDGYEIASSFKVMLQHYYTLLRLTILGIVVINLSKSVSMKGTRPALQRAWQNCSLQFVHIIKQFWTLMKVDVKGRGRSRENSMLHRITAK